MLTPRGDTERQAFLRDKSIKEVGDGANIYVTRILSVLIPQSKLLDVGCGTAHIIKRLAKRCKNILFIGLDISPAMMDMARDNIQGLTNVELVQGDGLELPFKGSEFDVVINRLADYSLSGVYRILKRSGYFFEYGLGPDADQEIKEFFPDRYEEENFFLPKDPVHWRKEVVEEVSKVGFDEVKIEDYRRKDHYRSKEEIMDLIEMVPLVKDFNREKDSLKVDDFIDRYRERNGIGITWHFYILRAQKL